MEHLHKADYVFETSWEICNKIGGIHTVISTKALSLLQEYKDNLILIGPDVWRDSGENPEFEEDETLFRNWKIHAEQEGLKVRTGRWRIVGKPIVLLVDFSNFISEKNKIFKLFWEAYQLDSLAGQWDYIEPSAFGYVVGKVIEHFCKYNTSVNDKIVAHFHEWMTGLGIMYLKKYAPHIATVFTTHATVIGRSIAGNGQALYGKLENYNAEQKAREFGVVAKQSCEKISANIADCLTTVSEITAKECNQFFDREVDVVTPNGFEDDFVPQAEDLTKMRKISREKMLNVAESLLGYELDKNVKIIATSGRYEYRNKGIDVFLDALKLANSNEKTCKEIVAFLFIPANNYGARKDLQIALNDKSKLNEVNRDGANKLLTHGLHHANYDTIISKLNDLDINNAKDDKIKIIFVPSYLKGNDGVFNLPYYDLLSGVDLTVFPSYYEPWGYTPLESLAFHIPTITTSLAGFGQWINSRVEGADTCMRVVERTDDNYLEVAQNISDIIIDCTCRDAKDLEKIRKGALEISKSALWENFIAYYKKAYSIALEKVKDQKVEVDYSKHSTPVMELEPKRSNKPVWRTIQVQPNLSGQFKGLEDMAYNLWWVWNSEAIELWEYIAGESDLWKKTRYNPVSLLKEVTYDRIQELEKDKAFVQKYNKVYKDFQDYMSVKQNKNKDGVAYFCMEYGLSDTLKIFSGGLGILAGDYLKEASDCNSDMIAVGLLYRYGYFSQQLTLQGEQLAKNIPQDFRLLPIKPIKDKNGEQLFIQLALPGRVVNAQVWKVNVGRVDLYLLDTDRLDNQEQDRGLTHHLYGGDRQNRLKQEMLLGVGGIRALEAMGISKKIYHMNEGHAALIGVERMHKLINKENFTFNEALEIVRASTLFTTHTPVPAGHDTFPEDMIMTYMGHYPERLKISWKDFINLGKADPNNYEEEFSMSFLAANLSQEINGVSMLHGEVTRYMFNKLWEGYYPDELHIGYVTNGVHYPTWTNKEWKELYHSEFGKNFSDDQSNFQYWQKIHKVSDQKIWDIRQRLRKELFTYIHERLDSTWVQRREDPKKVVKIKNTLDENVLTIGFARRFATYKRGNLLFKDLDTLSKIVNNPDRPVQFIFAGKAHPNDGGGQAIIKQIVEISKHPEFLGKILFLENYDMSLAQKLVAGVDIWLNTPTRPLEASGTSGMKAVMNGALHFSVLDGWWVEGYRKNAGWALDQEQTYDDHEFQNELDAEVIYRIIENEITPLFYNRDKNGVPVEWVKFIKNSISNIAPEFTMKRMLDDYKERFYTKLEKRFNFVSEVNFKEAKEMAAWKQEITRTWESIIVEKINFFHIVKDPLYMGEEYFGEIIINLNEYADDDIGVELVLSEALPNGNTNVIDIKDLKLMKREGRRLFYAIEMIPSRPGNFNYGFRMFPINEKLPNRQDLSYVRWI